MNAIDQLKEKQKLELERLKIVFKADEIFIRGKQKADLKLDETLLRAKAAYDKSTSLAKTAHQKCLGLLKTERAKVK